MYKEDSLFPKSVSIYFVFQFKLMEIFPDVVSVKLYRHLEFLVLKD